MIYNFIFLLGINLLIMTLYKIQNSSQKLPIGKIICLVRSYPSHAAEMSTPITKHPLFFIKPTSSIIFHNQSIIIPDLSPDLQHEVELGIVMGRQYRHIHEKDALDYIFGYLLCPSILPLVIYSRRQNSMVGPGLLPRALTHSVPLVPLF